MDEGEASASQSVLGWIGYVRRNNTSVCCCLSLVSRSLWEGCCVMRMLIWQAGQDTLSPCTVASQGAGDPSGSRKRQTRWTNTAGPELASPTCEHGRRRQQALPFPRQQTIWSGCSTHSAAGICVLEPKWPWHPGGHASVSSCLSSFGCQTWLRGW